MKTQIESKVHEIADVLFEKMEQHTLDSQGLGLLSGQMGIIIFCKHYLDLWPNSAKEKILDRYLEQFFDKLTSGMDLFTYCSGLSGVFDGLKYLSQQNLLQIDYSDIENTYKPFLQEYALTNIANINYDFMHGGMGVVKYFADDPHFGNRALDMLEQNADKDPAGYKWKSQIGMEREIGYNISLSHGMSSIVSVLSLLTHPEINKNKRDLLLTNACNYILSQEVDYAQYGCFFPSVSLEHEVGNKTISSRLAWCYGDLGVATSLWQAGKALHNKQWMDKALAIFTFSASKRSFEEAMVRDGELCHGTASIAMMFHYMSQEAGDCLYEETRNYWLEKTLELSVFEDGLAGYKTWKGVEESWQDEYDLLEGVTGVGLVLMTLTKNDIQKGKWVNFFLLN